MTHVGGIILEIEQFPFAVCWKRSIRLLLAFIHDNILERQTCKQVKVIPFMLTVDRRRLSFPYQHLTLDNIDVLFKLEKVHWGCCAHAAMHRTNQFSSWTGSVMLSAVAGGADRHHCNDFIHKTRLSFIQSGLLVWRLDMSLFILIHLRRLSYSERKSS